MKIKNILLLAAVLCLAALPALAAETETLCSGVAAQVKLDLATGTVRTPAATETLTYSTEWDGGSAVTLAANGETLASGLIGSGTYDWTPSGEGLFTLTHTVVTNGTPVVLSALFNVPVKVARNTATGTEYTSVQAAFDEATSGQTIALLTDVTESVMITTGQANTLDLAGHVLKGDGTGTMPVVTINSADAAITIRDSSTGHTGAITTGGAEYVGNGAGINIAAGSLSLYDVTITNCVANGSGGAIYQAEYANLLMSGCTVKNNTASASGGGIYKKGGCTGAVSIETCYGKSVLLQTEVIGNAAGTSGGGVYFQKMMEQSSCFVAGTRVAMADGTTKAIEDVKEGDVVKTFDHEGGTNSTARVFIWLKEAVTTRAFTLAFADGSSVNCVLTHDFLMKDGESSCKYVCLGRANAADYVGKLFYGMDGAWHELLSVTDGEEVSEIYELYTAQHFNSYANGLLTVPADVEVNLNLYKLDANLKADATELAADVAKYGYYTYEEAAARGVSRAYYDDSGIKYVNVIVGKGLATWEELENTYASAQGLTSTVSTPTPNVPRLTSLAAATNGEDVGLKTSDVGGQGLTALPKLTLAAAAPKLAAAGAEATLDDFDAGVLTLGAGVAVTNNTASGAKSNIYLATANSGADSLVALTATHDGVCAGVSCSWGAGPFTTNENVSASDVALFTSDSSAYVVKFEIDHLELVSVVMFTPTTIDHTTAAVYTNGVPMEVAESYQIESNATAMVVYTAADGYVFADGSTAKTNDINTLVNPATAEAPAAPVKLIKYTAPVYVDNVASNGIAYWTTNAVPSGYTVVGSSASRVTWGVSGATSWYVVIDDDIQIDGGIACTGDVRLVLCDGGSLTATASEGSGKAGISVFGEGNSLAVYAQDFATNAYTGKLTATGKLPSGGYSTGAAGIGGDTDEAGLHITINGGVVSATGANGGAGIGGGYNDEGRDITINGGHIMATAVDSLGAGIGGGSYAAGYRIAINGGIVTARAAIDGAGIGGGYRGAGSQITITGGEIEASSCRSGAGIGGGAHSSDDTACGFDIVISGGTVTATSGINPSIGDGGGAGIGGGAYSAGSNITIRAGTVTATGSAGGAGIGAGVCTEIGEVIGANIAISGGTVTATGVDGGAGIGGGKSAGSLMSACRSAGRNITIDGGMVTAIGSDGAAAIGGGSGVAAEMPFAQSVAGGDASNIAISGGTVWVRGGATTDNGGGVCIGAGGGYDAGAGSASGVTIADAANVMFDLVGADGGLIAAALPGLAGFWILTPETLTEERTLVTGCGAQGLSALPAFTLRKTEQERTKEIEIDGESVPFADAMLTLANDVAGTGLLKLTVDELPTDPVVQDKDGNDVEIEVPQTWREEKGVKDEDVVDTVNTNDNGMVTWQSYVLGLDPTNKLSVIYADTPQNTNENAVTIETKNIDEAKVADGYGLQYRLEKIETQDRTTSDKPSFDVDVTGDDPTGHYQLSVVIAMTNAEGEVTQVLDQTAEAINTVGMVKQTQAATNAIVSVPWGRLAPGTNQCIAVSNVVKTANLDEGDELRVYRPGETNYEAWVLNENKTWDKVITLKLTAVSPLPTLATAGEPEDATIPRGSGIWLCRKGANKDKPYYLYGQSNGEESEVAVVKGANLIGATGIGDYDLDEHVTGALENDKIVIPGENDVPRVMTMKNGAWGYWASVPGKTVVFKGVTNTTYETVWVSTNSVIKAGTGFWLHNNSGKVEVR